MPTTPNQQNSSVRISKSDMESGDPSRLNRILNLLAQKIPSDQQVQQIVATYITNNSTSGGGGGGGGSGTSTGPTILSDTHANRLLSFPAASYTVDSLFWETDRTVLYICLYPSLSPGNVWQYALGTMRDSYANRPTDVSTYDEGFLFYATDKQLTYRWSGTAWSIVSNFQPVIQDTHANRLTNFPSTFYPTGSQFWETDRTVMYVNQDATGTLTATGTTTVNWVSGDRFDAGTNWEGKTITINGVAHTVATTTSAIQLVTSSAVAAGVGVTFTVSSGKWQYASGQFNCQQAVLPADLLSSDDGFLAGVINFNHMLQWLESSLAWNWAPGDNGSMYVQMFAVDPTPSTGWKIANGIASTYLNGDGTVTAFTPPNLLGTPAYPKFGSPYTGVIDAAVAPLITGSVASGTAVFAAGTTGSANGSAGTTGISGTGASIPATTGSSGTGASIPATTGNDSAAQVVAAGIGANVPAEPHTHAIGAITDPGHNHAMGSISDPGHAHTIGSTSHSHTVADTGHVHTVGTLVNGLLGEPVHIILRPWFRR